MTTQDRFGTLDDVALNDAWAHEAHDFTPWLSENLDRLSEAIGIPLELSGTEVAVEEFSADIIVRNVQDDSRVLIENQFKTSDHGHLGQILTYLAGSKSHTIIWIAPGFRDPHLSAVRWLNENTVDPFAFFAVKLKVVRIGDSPMVPLFEVLERPNDWERRVGERAAQGSPAASDLGSFRREFWAHFISRHPCERAFGEPNGASSRWRPVASLPIVISSYVAQGGVGIFYRSPRGVDPTEAGNLLQPVSEGLEKRLGVGFNSDRYLFISSKRFDMRDRSNWDRAADWPKAEADCYEAALEDALGGETNGQNDNEEQKA